MADRAEIRAGDRDRDQVAEILRVAVSEGRITVEELHERLDRTYAARTFGELDAIVADLPHAEILPALRPDSGEVLRLYAQGGKSFKQVGRWVVPPRIDLTAGWGTVKVDFTQAVCHHRVVAMQVTCDSPFGDIVIRVPRDGWWVDDEEVVTSGWGGVHNKPPAPPTPETIVLKLSGRLSGDIWVRYRRPRD